MKILSSKLNIPGPKATDTVFNSFKQVGTVGILKYLFLTFVNFIGRPICQVFIMKSYFGMIMSFIERDCDGFRGGAGVTRPPKKKFNFENPSKFGRGGGRIWFKSSFKTNSNKIHLASRSNEF